MKHIARCERYGRLFLVEYIEGLLDRRVTHREGDPGSSPGQALLIGAPEACSPVHHDPIDT